jgi:polyphosphate kinase
MQAIDSQVAQRGKGWAVRLEIEAVAQAEIVERLVTTFELDEPLVFRVPDMVNLRRLFHFVRRNAAAASKVRTCAFGNRELQSH